MQRGRANPPLFWTVVVVIVVADVITKSLAVYTLFPQRMPHEVLGSAVRLTLVYNPGAAFGLHLGAYSRWIFMALLWRLFILGGATAPPGRDLSRVSAVALVCAVRSGSDRSHRSAQGVLISSTRIATAMADIHVAAMP